MVLRSRLVFAFGAVLTVGALVAACGSNGGANSSGGCVPGMSASCACANGETGAQTCSSDGKGFGTCQCGSSGGTGASSTTGAGASTGSGLGGGSNCQCTDPTSELYCGSAVCNDAGGTTGTGTGGSNACAGKTTFAGKAPTQLGSSWTYKADTGTAAGNQACVDMGADHVCDYDDLVFAASKGELTSLTATDNAWLLRYHSVTVAAGATNIEVLGTAAAAGTTLKVGPASRCADWTYSTDHLNDGEYVSFENGGNKPMFHLDDNPCVIQTAAADPAAAAKGLTAKDIPCGHNTMPRDVLCCYPKCMTVAPDTCTCNASTNTCM
jgi:hypothetical protein